MGAKKGLSYYITNFIIRAKGVKRIFKTNPLPYTKLRRDDVKSPPTRYLKSHISRTLSIQHATITEIETSSFSNHLILFFHGGAFVSGPTIYHWKSIEKIAKDTKITIWMCDYPKAPENNWNDIQDSIKAIYQEALKEYKPDQIIFIGDSAGGTLALNLVQRLQLTAPQNLPKQLILISPVVDLSLTNPDILSVDKRDPMLSLDGVKQAKHLLHSPIPLDHPDVSPFYGLLKDLPYSHWYIAENDITYPDQKLMLERLGREGIEHRVVLGEGMPHIWPYLPLMKQSKIALLDIIQQINSITK